MKSFFNYLPQTCAANALYIENNNFLLGGN